MAGAATSAGLAVVSAMFSLSPWVALLATVTTSITAYVKNHRYELMISLYQATAMRLQSLKDQWLDSGKTDADKAERDSLIQRSEETLALENGAWVAQWSQQPTQPEEAGRHSALRQPGQECDRHWRSEHDVPELPAGAVRSKRVLRAGGSGDEPGGAA